jgi:hypothetical protein
MIYPNAPIIAMTRGPCPLSLTRELVPQLCLLEGGVYARPRAGREDISEQHPCWLCYTALDIHLVVFLGLLMAGVEDFPLHRVQGCAEFGSVLPLAEECFIQCLPYILDTLPSHRAQLRGERGLLLMILPRPVAD